ncbi:hypothetical protein ACWDYJ_26750 [Streptomyces sp. NPDC003042]
MKQRTRIILLTPLLAGSLAVGPAALAWGAAPTGPAAAPTVSCFVEAAADAAKATISGDGFKKGKVFLDQIGGDGVGSAQAGDDGTFKSGEVPAGKWRAFQEGGPNTNCLGGKEAQDEVNKQLVDKERKRGATEGFAQGRELAQSGACDAKPNPPNLQRLAPDAAGQKAAQEAYDKAYEVAFNKAIDRFC